MKIGIVESAYMRYGISEGARKAKVHALMPFGYNSPENPERMLDINAEFMTELVKEAKAYGVKHINVENLPFPGLPLNYIPSSVLIS